MGWLCAVALGLQEHQGRTVAKSLVPMAIGHALAVGIVVVITVLLGLTLPLAVIRWLVAPDAGSTRDFLFAAPAAGQIPAYHHC